MSAQLRTAAKVAGLAAAIVVALNAVAAAANWHPWAGVALLTVFATAGFALA